MEVMMTRDGQAVEVKTQSITDLLTAIKSSLPKATFAMLQVTARRIADF
jgi:hypothetical protein